MRHSALVPALVLASALVVPVRGERTVAVPSVSTPKIEPRQASAPTPRLRAGRALRQSVAALDARVLASLLAMRVRSDFDVEVRAGDAVCDARTCTVPLAIRLPESMPPMHMSIAVANARGELSDVRHAECLTSVCNVQLVIERGRNTIAVGVADGLSQTAAFSLTDVVASPNLEARAHGRAEWF